MRQSELIVLAISVLGTAVVVAVVWGVVNAFRKGRAQAERDAGGAGR